MAVWLVVLGVALGTAAGLLSYAVIDLHAQVITLRQQDLRADEKTCSLAAGNRAVITRIAARVRPPVPVPPIPPEVCP